MFHSVGTPSTHSHRQPQDGLRPDWNMLEGKNKDRKEEERDQRPKDIQKEKRYARKE